MKVAVISGAASGVGLATVRRMISRGYSVLAIDRDEDAIEKNLSCIKDDVSHCVLSLDLTHSASIRELSDCFDARFSSASEIAVFSVAGRAHAQEFNDELEIEFDVFRASIETNLITHFVLLKSLWSCFESMPCKKSVVLVSSINAIQAAHLPAYSAAKSGLRGLAVSLSRPFQLKLRASINVVLLGTIKPEQSNKQEPKDMQALDVSTFRGTVLRNEEAADFLFWASQAPIEFTGQELIFDAGQSLGIPVYS